MVKNEDKQKGSWGGKRAGAGRKNIGSRSMSVTMNGEMAKLVEAQENRSQFIKECFELGYAQKKFRESLQDVEDKVIELPSVSLKAFNVEAAAGLPKDVGDVTFDVVDITSFLCKHTDACFIVNVKGDSMIYAGILPGDKIVVDPSVKVPSPDDAALCLRNGELAVKFVEKHGDEIWLVSANPKYEPIIVTESDQFMVLGVVSSCLTQRPKRQNMDLFL